MKILKKLLIICCFSLLFIINVNADTFSLQYSQSNIDRYYQYEQLIDNAREYALSNNLIQESNIVYYNLSYISYNTIRVSYLTGDYNASIRRFYTTNYDLTFDTNYNIVSHTNASSGYREELITYIINYGYFDPNFGSTTSYTITMDVDTLVGSNGGLLMNVNQPTNFYDFVVALGSDIQPIVLEPTYTLQQEILQDGSVKLIFNFTNYDSNNNYAFTITNKVSGEEYGIDNPYVSIFPKIIPFGSSYEIILQYDTIITISLSKYIPIEGTDLYDREPIFVDSYDINNVVFSNPQLPYFSIIFQNKDNLIGKFNNISNNNSCFYKLNTENVETNVNCNETLDLQLVTNGYIDIIIKKQNDIIYQRKINILGGSETEPYIVYNIEKQDFYNKINWYVQNYNSQLKYRYSINNGLNFSSWEILTNNQQFINVYQNSIIIIEISNNDNSIIYDSKAINVVVSIENLQNFNNTTNNLIDKFNNIFNVNGNILLNIETFWSTLKTTKLYLFVFIPFLTSIICAIIYLIRRK